MAAVELVFAVVAVLASYVVGTTPTAHLVAGRRGVDPTRTGSRNPGATNVYRLAGRRAGAAVLAIDLVKGVVPTAVALALHGRELALACGAAAVVGHVAPVARRFKGGKGVATAGGAALVMWPPVGAVLVLVFVSVARLAGTASVGSLVMAAGLPLGVGLAGRPPWEIVAAAALAVLVIARHVDNIRRLARGEERPIRHPQSIPPSLE